MNTHEFNDLRHFHLGEYSTRFVCGQAGDISNTECVRTFYCDLPRFASVQFCHSLYFRKCHKISILQPMARFFEASDKALLILCCNEISGMITVIEILTTDAIMPVRGCSPVGSTQVNFDPKSLKTELYHLCKSHILPKPMHEHVPE